MFDKKTADEGQRVWIDTVCGAYQHSLSKSGGTIEQHNVRRHRTATFRVKDDISPMT